MKQENELTISTTQQFNVSVEQTYDAWTNPEKLKQWWKPMDNTLKEVSNDLKEGGEVRYIFDKNNLQIWGNYIRVIPNQLLEYTWNWELGDDPIKNSTYKLVVEFKPEDGGSSIHVTQDAFKDEEGMLPHKEGWKNGLTDLNTFLSNKE